MREGYSPIHSTTISEAEAIFVLASLAFFIGARPLSPASVLYPIVGLLLYSLAITARMRSDQTIRLRESVATTSFAVFAVTAFVAVVDPRVARLPDGDSLALLWYGGTVAWLVFGVGLVWLARRAEVLRWGVAIAVVLTVILGADLIRSTPEPDIDVWRLHKTAADRLTSGESPYGGLAVKDDSPIAAEGQVIDGYPYPPVTLIAYSLGSWAGDPRWASLMAWLVVLFALASMVSRQSSRITGMALFAFVAMQPGWPFVLEFSWTEPVTLALLAVALSTWKRLPITSSIFFGLAVASKQYMAIALILLIFGKVDRKVTRVTISAGVALLTILPFFLADPAGMWSSLVAFFLEAPPRPDSSNLVGLLATSGVSWDPHPVITGLVPTGAAVALARTMPGSPSYLALSLAGVLAVMFFLGSQAFGNYWLLVAIILALGLAGRRDLVVEDLAAAE
jgi:hypothetical protein